MDKVGRRAFAGLIAAVGLCAALGAQAQAWPSKPVKFVVGAAAGGSASDAATRFFADRIREATGQAMLVENKPGAKEIIYTGRSVSAQAIFFSSGFHKQAVGDFLAKRPLAYDWDRFEKDGK